MTVLKQKSPEAEPRTGLMGGPSLPQKHLFRDLSLFVFAAMGPESGCSARGCLPAAQAGGGAVPAAVLCHPAVLALLRVCLCTGEPWLKCSGTGRNCQYLGLFPSVFNAWFWLVVLLIL